MKNLLILVLAAVVVIMGAMLYKNAQPVPAAGPAAAAPDTDPPADAQPSEANTFRVTPLEPESAEDPAKAQLEKAHDLIGALVAENKNLEAGKQPGPLDSLKRMVSTPEGKNMMRMQMKATLGLTHGGLFKRLGLDPETRKAIEELLIEQNMIGMESGFKMMSANADERAAFVTEMKTLREEVDSEAKQLLGEEKYAIYQDWQETQPERQVLQQFNMSLGDAQLDDEQGDQLVYAMRDAREEVKDQEAFGNLEHANPLNMTPDQTDALMKQTEAMHGRYVEKATKVLNEEQLAKFEENLKTQRTMLETGLKIQKAMLGGKPPEASVE